MIYIGISHHRKVMGYPFVIREDKRIKIVCKSDLDGLEKLKIPDVLQKYIKDYYNEMLLRFESENLEGLGSIFVLNSKEAVIASKLDEFLEKHPPYRTVGLTLYVRDSPISITHILLFINGYAINIFAEEHHLGILKKEDKA